LGRDEGLNRSGFADALGLSVLVTLAGAWELMVRSKIAEVQFLPAPSEIAAAAQSAVFDGQLIGRTLHTVGVTLLGWSVASLVGLGLGLLLGLSPIAYRYSMTSFEVTRAIPPITLAPAALLIFGFSLKMELVLVTFGGIWPVLVNTMGGVQKVAPELRDVGTMLGLSPRAMVQKIVFPAALPSVMVGLRLALSLCLVLAIVAEIVGNPAGLGNGLISARQSLQPALMFTYVITAGLLGVVLNAALGAVAKGLMPGDRARRDSSW